MAKRSIILLTSIVTLAVLMTAGCVTSTTPPSGPPTITAEAATLEGTVWTLTSLQTEEGTTQVLPNTTITAAFNNGNATGSSGCNHYFARYELSGQNRIAFTSLGSTVMYCTTPGVMAQETSYMRLLQNTTAYTVSADTLLLLNKGGQAQLVFKAGHAPRDNTNYYRQGPPI